MVRYWSHTQNGYCELLPVENGKDGWLSIDNLMAESSDYQDALNWLYKPSSQLEELNVLREEKKRLERNIDRLQVMVDGIALPKSLKLKISLERNYVPFWDVGYSIVLNTERIGTLLVDRVALYYLQIRVELIGEKRVFPVMEADMRNPFTQMVLRDVGLFFSERYMQLPGGVI